MDASVTRFHDMDFILIPGGATLIGSSAECPYPFDMFHGFPSQTVDIASFYLAKYPVTNLDFMRFAAENPSFEFRCEPGTEEEPVVELDFQTVKSFCDWAGVRLPSELEWEKAARGPKGFTYPWGDEFLPNACCCHCTSPCKVGLHPLDVSGYGCHDMAGNVRELTSSKFLAYPNSPSAGRDIDQSSAYVVRGGCWSDECDELLLTNRSFVELQQRDRRVGFRCVLDYPIQTPAPG